MIYRIARMMLLIFLKIFNRIEIEGEKIPPQGPLVIVANHKSLWDPAVLGCSIKRTIHYMAKEELFQIPVLGRLLLMVQAFPVKRGKIDRNALRIALKCLEEGQVLGLFPEGTRSKTEELLPFQPGAAIFALKIGAPIIPVALVGTKSIFPASLRGKVKVRIGKPLSYPELFGQKLKDEDLEKVNLDILKAISHLLSATNKDRCMRMGGG